MTELSLDEKLLVDSYIQALLSYNRRMGMHSGALWSYIAPTAWAFEKRRAAFLYTLQYLIENNKVKIGRNHVLLNIGHYEIIKSYQDQWPSESNFDDDLFFYIEDETTGGYQYWTPGDLVWIDEEGGEVWSTDAEH